MAYLKRSFGTITERAFNSPNIGTPSAGVGTNITGISATNVSAGTLPSAQLPTGTVFKLSRYYENASASQTSQTYSTLWTQAFTPHADTTNFLVQFHFGYQIYGNCTANVSHWRFSLQHNSVESSRIAGHSNQHGNNNFHETTTSVMNGWLTPTSDSTSAATARDIRFQMAMDDTSGARIGVDVTYGTSNLLIWEIK